MPSFAIILCIALFLAWAAYSGLILVFTYGWFRARKAGGKPSTLYSSRVSVIVAARNEEDKIMNLLEDLARQDYHDLQVIIVDDGSSDATYHRVSDYLAENPPGKIKIYRRDSKDREGSKKAAIEYGISLADGQIILLTDADCRLSPGWAGAMVHHFEDPEVQMVAGLVRYRDIKNLAERFQALEFLGLVASGAGAVGAGVPFMCNGANLAYRKQAFMQVDGFSGNERYRSGDDVFLLHKVKQHYGSRAIRFASSREAIVDTSPAGSFGAFLRQRARWASKSTGYHDAMAITTAITVFLFNMFLVVTLFAGVFYPPLLVVYVATIMLKTVADLPLLTGVTGFTRQRSLLKWLLIFQAAYPLYITAAGLWSFFRKSYW